MQKTDIVALITGFEGYEEMIDKIIVKDKEYKEAEEIFIEHLDTLEGDFKYMSKVEDSVGCMKIASRDIAFKEGFKMGVQFILGCVSGGGEYSNMSILERVIPSMLERNMSTNDFSSMLGDVVYEDSVVKEEDEKYTELLKNLSLSFDALDNIHCSINAMMARAIKVAYKKGFQDCICNIKD